MDKAARLHSLYGRIPGFACREGCVQCCENLIQALPEECSRVSDAPAYGSSPLGKAFCRHLTATGCSVYPARPLLCRLFGSAETMPCPHGCGPEHPLTGDEARGLVREYLSLGEAKEFI